MVSCADAAVRATVAASAATQTLCNNLVVSNMAFPPWVHSARFAFSLRSGRRDADASSKRLGNHELAIDDLERKPRQSAGGWSLDDRPALARIVPGIMTGTFKNLLFLHPTANFAARMRTDRRISDHAIGRTFPRSANQRCGIQTNQQHLVEPRTVAH